MMEEKHGFEQEQGDELAYLTDSVEINTNIDRFTLSKSNKILYGVVVLLGLLGTASMGFTPYNMGRLAGELLTWFLIPAAIAWILWRITGRKKSVRVITFNTILALLIIVPIVFGVMSGYQQASARNALELLKQQYQNELSLADSEEERTAIHQKYQKRFTRVISDSSTAKTL